MIVGVAAAAGLASTTFFNPVLGVFVAPLSEQFQWNRAQIALAVTIGSAAAAVASPAVGWVMDRWGGRWVMAPAALAMGLSLLALGRMTALWQLYVFYSLGRALSQGAIQTASFVAVSNWFVRRRPLAVAIVSVGQRAGMAVLPVLAAVVIAAAGWRAAWVALAVVILSLGVVPPLLLMRRRPEDSGLLPDGDPPAGPDDVVPAAEAPDWSLRAAARTRAYWLVGLGVGLMMFSAGSINLHQIPHMEGQGLGTTGAALVVSLFSVTAAAGSLLSGAVATRVGVRWTMAAAFVGQAVGVLLLIDVDGPATGVVYAVWYGLFFGSTVTLSQVIYADYFGRRSLGLIRGSFQPAQLALNALGPWLTGLWFDRSGSYDAPFTLFAVIFLAVGAFVALSPRPRPPGTSARRSAGPPGGRRAAPALIERGRVDAHVPEGGRRERGAAAEPPRPK